MYLNSPVPRGWDAPDGLWPRAQDEGKRADNGGSNNTVVFIVSCFTLRAGGSSLTITSLVIGYRECCRLYRRRGSLGIHLQEETKINDNREQEARLLCSYN